MGSVKGMNIAIFCLFFLVAVLFSVAHFGMGTPIRGSAYAVFALLSALMAIREIKLWKKERNSRRF
ncbi:hypothetical protein [Salinicoccus roseus]|uniref:hypothetical protein n=1 Tax=Salinicoccus roseus TaxID=45670 RepID=UPI00356478DC